MSKKTGKKIILASASPRRREILTLLGLDFEVLVSDADENVESCAPDGRKLSEGEITAKISEKKALAVKEHLMTSGKYTDDCIIIAADTTVLACGELLGKPKDNDDARRMLRLVSGREHSVISGLTVIKDGKTVSCYDESLVTFKTLTEEEIDFYIGTSEPFGKAGAYAVQGTASLFIEKIEGDFFTIVGLPVHKLYEILGELWV